MKSIIVIQFFIFAFFNFNIKSSEASDRWVGEEPSELPDWTRRLGNRQDTNRGIILENRVLSDGNMRNVDGNDRDLQEKIRELTRNTSRMRVAAPYESVGNEAGVVRPTYSRKLNKESPALAQIRIHLSPSAKKSSGDASGEYPNYSESRTLSNQRGSTSRKEKGKQMMKPEEENYVWRAKPLRIPENPPNTPRKSFWTIKGKKKVDE